MTSLALVIFVFFVIRWGFSDQKKNRTIAFAKGVVLFLLLQILVVSVGMMNPMIAAFLESYAGADTNMFLQLILFFGGIILFAAELGGAIILLFVSIGFLVGSILMPDHIFS